MLTKGWKIIGIVNALILVSVIVWFCAASPKSKKIAFVDNIRLFNEFNLKKEIEKDISKVRTARKNQLDSIRLSLELVKRNLESGKVLNREMAQNFETAKQQYLLKEEQMQQDNKAMARKGDEQVWKQLNEYVKEYGKENGYEFLLGTSGEGNLMYASDKNDITSEIIKYVNEKYSGKK